MMTEQIQHLIDMMSETGLTVKERQAEKLIDYYNMLVEKNKVMNLTRITDFEEAVKKHFADSLMVSEFVDVNKYRNILDLGTGAGFPGIPLAIMYPEAHIVMIDSVGKKVNFVNEAIEKLGLNHMENDLRGNDNNIRVRALHVRAEDLARDAEYREKFDLCVSRAVANLSTLSEYCLPFVKKGGLFAAYKSDQSEEEINAAERAVRTLGGNDPKKLKYSLFNMGRTMVIIEKENSTPRQYPRKAGLPAKSPLE